MFNECPNCKHELADENLAVCPRCSWNLKAEFEPTAKPSPANPVSTSPPRRTPSLAQTTLDPPTDDPTKIEIARQPEPTFPFDSQRTAQDHSGTSASDPLSESSRQNQDSNLTPTFQNPLSETGSVNLPAPTRRSIKTVIPQRTVSKDTDPGKLQDYQLGKRIGSGSFGVVFRAKQLPLDRPVALKVLTSVDKATGDQLETIQTEFLREAQFTGKLEHPNIVPIHDIGLTVDAKSGVERPFYVMKEIHGVSWLQKIQNNSQVENLDIFKRVVDAIAFAHSKNVLHCDLKPENVMLGEFGEVLLVDWGQAIDLSRPESIRPGGTPAYISPEMARYWCDIYLDRKPESPARVEVGPRSDVYLLGGILMEIVTGELPRNADQEAGESQYDVMRRACRNDVDNVAGFENDELMKIARRAMRVSDDSAIDTIEDLQSAIREFETRSLSIQLRHHADQLLSTAKTDNSYDCYQKAKLSYEESLDTWSENVAAKNGLQQARLNCAELALADQNFDLGLEMLAQPTTEQEKSLFQELSAGKTSRDRRKKLVARLAFWLAASIMIGITVLGFMIKLNNDSIKLRDSALAEKQEIETKKKDIENRIEPMQAELVETKAQIAANDQEIEQFPGRLIAEQEKFDQQLIHQKSKQDAELASQQVLSEKELENQSRESEIKLAEQRRANDAQIAAEQLRTEQARLAKQVLESEVETLNESSKILRTKNAVTNVLQKLDSGNFRESRELLDAFKNKQTWEWSRLNLLAHREVESVYPSEPVTTVAASADGRRLAIAFAKRLEIYDSKNLTAPISTLPASDVSAIALSKTGDRLALAVRGAQKQSAGKILIFDLSDGKLSRPIRQLDAQSNSIDCLEFSLDGQRLLSVGTPSALRKSAGESESELMIWDNYRPLKVVLTNDAGAKPNFSRATFSADGTSVLTSNPAGLPLYQFLNLWTETEQEFRWTARSPIASLNCAVFANDQGNEIIACGLDPSTQTYDLMNWIPRTGDQPRKESGFVSVGSSSRSNEMAKVAQLPQKILHLDRVGDWLLTSGEDRQVTRWNLLTKTSKTYRGHSRPVDFCKIVDGNSAEKPVLISVATGSTPEIIKTDLQTYRTERDSNSIASFSRDDKPSPTTSFHSRLRNASAFGNDQGQIAVVMPASSSVGPTGLELSPTIPKSEFIERQWELSAWKKHVLTPNFLFAQSRGDLFYQYHRPTGKLERVLTGLATPRRNPAGGRFEIVRFEASDDARRAVVVTNAKTPEFEIWDLENEKLLRKIDYGAARIFGSDTDKQLLQIKLSPDGKWVVAGKVSLFAWSTETGQQVDLQQSSADRARTSINSIQFVRGTAQFMASWKGRVDLFDLTGGEMPQRFNLSQLRDSKTESNVLDCALVDGKLRVLIHAVGEQGLPAGIVLLDLRSGRELKRFSRASNATFSRRNPDEILVLQQDSQQTQLKRFSASTRMEAPVKLNLPTEFESRFQMFSNVHEFSDGETIIQSTTSNPLNPLRGHWNSISFAAHRNPGALRVFAKPRVEFCAMAGDRAMTLESGNLRFWTVGNNGIIPQGIFCERCSMAKLAPDERWLVVVSADDNECLIIDAVSGKTTARLNEGADATEISTVSWSANSKQLIVGRQNGVVEFWEWDGINANQAMSIVAQGESNSILQLEISTDGQTLLTLFANSNEARISHQEHGEWSSYLIQNDDGQKFVAGDILDDGSRAVTGTDRGRLTVWNTEPIPASTAAKPKKIRRFGIEREIFDLGSQHQSPIRFVEFIKNGEGQLEIISAEGNSGQNEVVHWPVRS